jgi:hypothetical protein
VIAAISNNGTLGEEDVSGPGGRWLREILERLGGPARPRKPGVGPRDVGVNVRWPAARTTIRRVHKLGAWLMPVGFENSILARRAGAKGDECASSVPCFCRRTTEALRGLVVLLPRGLRDVSAARAGAALR